MRILHGELDTSLRDWLAGPGPGPRRRLAALAGHAACPAALPSSFAAFSLTSTQLSTRFWTTVYTIDVVQYNASACADQS